MKRVIASVMGMVTRVLFGLSVLSLPAQAQLGAGGVTGVGGSPSIAFGDTQVNTTKVLSLTLTASEAVTFDTPAVIDTTLTGTPFSLAAGDDGCSGKTLAATSGTCTIAVRYTPTAETSSASYIRVATKAPVGYPGIFVNLSGTGITGGASTTGTLSITPASPFTISASLSDVPTQILILKATQSVVAFTSAIANTNVTDIVVSSAAGTSGAAPSAIGVTAIQGNASASESHALTFQNMIAGQSVTVDGLTLTATGAIDAADVAAGFARLAASANTGGAVANGTWSGALSANWSSGVATGGNVSIDNSRIAVPDQWKVNNLCGDSVRPGYDCVIMLYPAVPVKAGTYQYKVVIQASDKAHVIDVTLSVSDISSGTQGTLSVSPTSLAFGTLRPGESMDKTVTITAGTANVAFTGVDVPTGFSAVHSCGTLIPVGGTCTATITFSPTKEVTYAGSAVINTSGQGAPHFVTLSGTGSASATQQSQLTVTPATLDFGALELGTSLTKSFSITASGTNITLAGITAPTGFTVLHSCGTVIPAGSTCSGSVTFAPTEFVPYNGSIIIEKTTVDSGGAIRQEVIGSLTLSGLGRVSSGLLTVTPATLDFGALGLGTSLTKSFSITASGTNITLAGITAPIGYTVLHSCGTVIPAGSTCSGSVTFTPTKLVPYNGSIIIERVGDSGTLSKEVIGSLTLSGSGSASSSLLTVTPATLDFGALRPGASLTKSFSITNSGNNVTLAGITAPTGFTVLHSCGTVIPAGSTCSASVTFTPTELAPYNAIIIEKTSLLDMGNGIFASGPEVIGSLTLSGSGSTSASQPSLLTFTPETLDFGTLRPGAKQTKSIRITANSTNVTLGVITLPTGYTIVHSCGTVIPSGSTCSASITFAPTAKIPYDGSLIIEIPPDTVQFATLKGSGGDTSGSSGGGTSGGVPMLVLDDALLDFGSLATGTTGEKTLTLANRGGAELSAIPVLVGSGFSLDISGCLSSGRVVIAAGATCSLTVKFTPNSVGAKSGRIGFTGTGATGNEITLRGSGSWGGSATASSGLIAASTNLAFGAVAVGGSAVKTLTLTTANARRPSIASMVVPSGYFASHDCATVSTASCTLTLALAPEAEITYQGLVVISATDGSAVFITVSGQGSAAAQMTARTRGSNQAIDMTGMFRFSAEQTSNAGNLYVAVLYNDALYFLSGGQWSVHINGVEPPAYMRAASLSNELTILINQDVSMLSGAVVFMAYGQNFDEVVRKHQYTPVYVVE